MLFAFICVVLLLLVLFRLQQCVREFRHRKRATDGIFSLPALPLIGHILLLPKCRYEWNDFLIEHSNAARREGHTLIRWWVLNKLCIWAIDAESAKAVLENSVELRKGRDYAFFGQWLGQGLLLSDGAKWRRQRRMLTPTFHFSKLEQYTGIFNKHARALASTLSGLAADGQAHDLAPLITRCSLDIVAEAIMGVRLDSANAQCRAYVRAVKQFNDLAHQFTTSPLHTIFPLSWHLSRRGAQTRQCVRTLKQFTRQVLKWANRRYVIKRQVIDERIEKRRTEGHQQQQKSAPDASRRGMTFLDMLLDMEHEQLDREELREQVDTFMFEGPSALASLRYMDRCIREALRLFPPVPVLERDLQNDMHIVDDDDGGDGDNGDGGDGDNDDGDGDRQQRGPIVLPRGTMVLVSPMILHHNDAVFARHRQFDPDRFLPDAAVSRNPFDYIPFSAGPRNCIGQRFALLEVKVVLAHLLRRCRLSPTAAMPFAANRPALEAILRPEHGLPVQLHPAED